MAPSESEEWRVKSEDIVGTQATKIHRTWRMYLSAKTSSVTACGRATVLRLRRGGFFAIVARFSSARSCLALRASGSFRFASSRTAGAHLRAQPASGSLYRPLGDVNLIRLAPTLQSTFPKGEGKGGVGGFAFDGRGIDAGRGQRRERPVGDVNLIRLAPTVQSTFPWRGRHERGRRFCVRCAVRADRATVNSAVSSLSGYQGTASEF